MLAPVMLSLTVQLVYGQSSSIVLASSWLKGSGPGGNESGGATIDLSSTNPGTPLRRGSSRTPLQPLKAVFAFLAFNTVLEVKDVIEVKRYIRFIHFIELFLFIEFT